MTFRKIAALILMVAATACHKKPLPPVAATPPAINPVPIMVATSPPAVTPPPVSISPPIPTLPSLLALPPVPPATRVIEDATRAFNSGDYARAVAGFDEYLRLAPEGDQRDRALFHLGLIYALPEFPQRDWKKSEARLQQVVSQSPKSLYQPIAQLLLNLRSDVQQLNSEKDKQQQTIQRLTTELERLRKIDEESLGRRDRD